MPETQIDNLTNDSSVAGRAPLRVLHVTFDMNIGGTEQVICQIVRGSVNRGVRHYLVCIDGEIGPMARSIRAELADCFVLARRPGFDIALLPALRRIAVENNIDIVHGHQYTPYVYALMGVVGRRVKVVFTEHGRFYPDSYSWRRRICNILFQMRTTAVTAISRATADALIEFEWFRRNKIEVIYNGISQPKVSDAVHVLEAVDRGKLVFGTVCRFDSIKNLPLLIRSFADLCAEFPDSVLVLVGDGVEMPKLRKLVVALDVQSRVIFTGLQADPPSCISRFDIFVLPSFSEGASMTLLEAMALARPAIVTRVGGNPELISDGVDGRLVSSDNQPEMVSAMRELASDAHAREHMGHAARATFQRKFSLQRMIDSYMRVYRAAGR